MLVKKTCQCSFSYVYFKKIQALGVHQNKLDRVPEKVSLGLYKTKNKNLHIGQHARIEYQIKTLASVFIIRLFQWILLHSWLDTLLVTFVFCNKKEKETEQSQQLPTYVVAQLTNFGKPQNAPGSAALGELAPGPNLQMLPRTDVNLFNIFD